MRPRWQRRLLSLFAVYPHVDLDNSGGDRRLWRGPLDRFDAVALAFIGLVAIVLLARVEGLKPFISDSWYHLAVAKAVGEQGAIPEWVTWDYAPVGRPHLYPPLVHVLLAGLARITGSLVAASQVLAVLFLPCSYLSCWYAARWLFGSRTALVALLALSLDLGHAVVELIYIPSCFVNILGPLLLVTFLTRRTWASIILLALMFYAHLGIPYLLALGLVLFGLKYPRYRAEAAKVVGIALLWAAPWLIRAWVYRDWIAGVTHNLGLPMGFWQRIISLQMFNIVLIGSGLWGLRNLRKWKAQEGLVRWLLIGMLPLLFSYGGRYTMHSAPFWALSAATVLTNLLPAGATWKRGAALILGTLLPTPALMPLTTTHALIMIAVTGRPPMDQEKPRKSEAYDADCEEVARWLRSHTALDEVVHVNKEWIGDLIPLLADRRADFGAWWECSREIGKLQNRYLRDDGRRAVFVCIKPESDVGSILGPTQRMPAVDERLDIGRFAVGIRHARTYQPRTVLDSFTEAAVAWRAEPGGRSTLGVSETPFALSGKPPVRFLTWRIPAGKGEAPEIARPIATRGAEGLLLNIRATAPLGEAYLGVTEADGSRYRWQFALPCVERPLHLARGESKQRALWLRQRVPFACMMPDEGSTDGNGALDPGQINALWLQAPKDRPTDLEIDLDDIEFAEVVVQP